MERPTGVTILGVLAVIGAACSTLAIVFALVFWSVIANMAQQPGREVFAKIGVALVVGFFLFFTVLYAVIALGMFRLFNWTRILVIVLSFIAIALYAITLPIALLHFQPLAIIWDLIIIGVNLWIAMYLLKPHVKQAFGATGF